jgi:hypothetical protein
MAHLILPFKGDTTDNSIHMLYDHAGTSLRLEQSLLRPMSPNFLPTSLAVCQWDKTDTLDPSMPEA